MKVFILAVCLTLSGLLQARELKGQDLDKVYVSLQLKNSDLKAAFKKIETLTAYRFTYKSEEIARYHNLTYAANKASLEKVLHDLLKSTDLGFEQVDNAIIIKKSVETVQVNNSQPVSSQASLIPVIVSGRVIDTTGTPLTGASISIQGTGRGVVTNEKGEFMISAQSGDQLVISFIGYIQQTIKVIENLPFQNIVLHANANNLNEVVVSTGYQTLPKERATGSFVKIDNELLNRRISTNIIDRLEDVTSGLIFNKGKTDQGSIRIRGQNTIYGNANPLIVIDNFPYDGDIDNINPNDVESITVLKDAAAASIWGARAGNGVIVITTKKGRYNQAPVVSLNTNLTIGGKPNIYYQPRMSSADFIDIEKTLFAQGYYTTLENSSSNPALTPVVELLIAKRDGKIGAAEADNEIEQFKNQDVRNDFEKYFYQRSTKQQYSLNINGGGDQYRYYILGGYDRNIDNLVGNGYNRISLNASNNFTFLKGKLEATANVYYTQSKTITDNTGTDLIGLKSGAGNTLYPYAQLADANGNPLAINHDYRNSFIQSAENKGFLDWSYKPLAELSNADNSSVIKDYRINTSLKYKIIPSLNIETLYQYDNTATGNRNYQSPDSYYTRNLINSDTQVNGTTLTYPIPLGGILDLGNVNAVSQNFRAQLNFTRDWNEKNDFIAIAGYEINDYHTVVSNNRFYGYDDNHATVSMVNYTGVYSQSYNTGSSLSIPFNDGLKDLTDRYISYYSNASYSYNKKYTISASGRLDRSNLFGVNTNQQGVPLYSAGFAWNISKENFYKSDLLPYLKLRVTYGYNGNVNKSLSAFTTASYLTGNAINQTYANIINPPNPDLRWERVKMINIGFDFATKNDRITGTIEPFFKKGLDLIGDIAYAPSTGITSFRGNTANTSGHGIDITLNSNNLTGKFSWKTNLLFSYVTDKVVDYALKQPAMYYTNYAETEVYPLEGHPFYALYSYKWAGLDPKTGDPQGYLNGAVSKDYTSILAAATPDDLVYSGSARPTTYGSLRNTFTWQQISLSFNISYRFGYYFRKQGIFYSDVLTGQGYYYGSYSSRWQKPGDELTTSVPSMPSSIDNNRDAFYNYSEATIEKADNVRLQDISLGYEFSKAKYPRLPFRQMQLYMYANNIGILWKATKTVFDPDYPNADYVPVRTVSLGIKVGL